MLQFSLRFTNTIKSLTQPCTAITLDASRSVTAAATYLSPCPSSSYNAWMDYILFTTNPTHNTPLMEYTWPLHQHPSSSAQQYSTKELERLSSHTTNRPVLDSLNPTAGPFALIHFTSLATVLQSDTSNSVQQASTNAPNVSQEPPHSLSLSAQQNLSPLTLPLQQHLRVQAVANSLTVTPSLYTSQAISLPPP